MSVPPVLRRLYHPGRLVGSLGIAYAPGFALPFAVALFMRGSASDAVLLALSTATAVGSIIGIAYETAWAAFAAALAVRHLGVSRRVLRSGVSQAIISGIVVSSTLLPLFAASYLIGGRVEVDLLFISIAGVALYPVASGIASVMSGILNAYSRIELNLLLQGLRGLIALSSVGVAAAVGQAWVIAVGLTTGEVCRAVVTRVLVASILVPDTSTVTPPSLKQLMHHGTGLAVSNSAPLLDRAFFAAGPVGTVTAFELADRVFFAASQICNTVFILPRIPDVAKSLMDTPASTVARREIGRVARRSTAFAVAIAVPAFVLLIAGPPHFRHELVWCILLLLSLPAGVAGGVATRMAVAAGRAQILPALSLVGVVVNLCGNLVGYAAVGATGVIVSTIIVRYLLLLLTLRVLTRARRDLSSPFPESDVT